MEKPLAQIYQTLHKLTGLHRQLLDTVRLERTALVQAEIKEIQSVTSTKQALIEAIHQSESVRMKQTGELALHWRKPFRDLTLPNIIIEIQGRDQKSAEQFRSIYNTLNVLIQHILEQNSDNSALIQKSIGHIQQMKKNVLGEASAKSSTYTQQGQKTSSPQSARLISKEV